MKNRVVITGIGIIAPIGINADEFWNNALKGISKVEKIPDQWLNYNNYTSSIWTKLPEIDFLNNGITEIEQKQLDKSSLLGIHATFEALKNSNIEYNLVDAKRNKYNLKSINKNKSGVFIGTGIGGIDTLSSCLSFQILERIKNDFNELINNNADKVSFKKILDKMLLPKRFNPYAVSMIMSNANSANLSIKFGIEGPNRTFNAACASGTVAIGNSYNAIKNGEIDMAIAGGVEYMHDEYGALFYAFDVIKALVKNNGQDKDSAYKPFDVNRSGFLYSQGGAGILIIENLNHALKRDTKILAEIIGYSENSDAYNIMMMEPNGFKMKDLIFDLFKKSEIKADRIDYINAHGTGTELNDEAETKVIEEIFGTKPLINTTKSLIGHTLGASGAIEAAVTALSIKNKTTHISKNLENPIRELNFVTKTKEYDINTALSFSFGFGGHNAALALKEYSA